MDGVKVLVGERFKMKVYPLLLVCQSTGALHIQVAHDYSTSGLVIQWNQFVGVRGRPSTVMTDQGGQLTSSDNSIKSDLLSWEQVKKRDARRT